MDNLNYRGENNSGTLDFTKKSWRDDVTFVIEDMKFYASKSVLSLYSPVFDKMFGSNFKETEETDINLPGKKAEDFMEFLQCLYPTTKASVTETNVLQVLPLADEYQVAPLMDECRVIIQKSISSTDTELTLRDSVEYYAAVTRYGLKEQSSLCVDEIVRQGNYEMISSEAEDLLTKEALMELQKNIISKQEEHLKDVTTKFVKLHTETKCLGAIVTSGFENAMGATIEYTIDDVFDSKLLNEAYSKPIKLWNVSFYISVSVCRNTVQNQSDNYLSVSLQCSFPDNDAGWSCDVIGDIILEDVSTDERRFLASKSLTDCQFSSKTRIYGYKSFEKISQFLSGTGDSVGKYSCKVAAYVLAKKPKKEHVAQANLFCIVYANTVLFNLSKYLYHANRIRN